MREREMRQRIERFLRTRLRTMLAPATLGLGLAMTACPSGGLDTTDDAGALVNKDGGADQGPAMKYLAPMPDAGATSRDGEMVALYSAQLPDSGPALRYMAQMPDASPDGEMALLYMAPAPRS